jgi:hypothetical protein
MLLVADFGVKAAVENQLADRVQKAVPSATSTTVQVSSFPFLGRLLVSGTVAKIHAAATDVTAGPVHFARVTVDLHDAHISRDALLRERKVDLTGVGSGTATAEVTQQELSRLLGVPVELGGGRISVRAGPLRASAAVSVQDNVLRVNAGPLSLPTVHIPKAPFLPCAANAEVLDGRIRVSCTVDRVPPELIEAVRNSTTATNR